MTQYEKSIEYMDEREREYLRLEPRQDYDQCIVGVAMRLGDTVLLYSMKRILDVYMQQGMNYREAREFFEYNTVECGYGDLTPVFLLDVI